MNALQQRIRGWRENPLKFAWDEFQFVPDKWQEEYLREFPSQDPKKLRISLQACVGPGKSAVLAISGLNFLTCYARGSHHPNGAAVSITSDNLRDNLWKEFAVWLGRGKLTKQMFEWQAERIFAREHPRTWWLSARSFSKNADAQAQGRTLSGLHSPFVLVLLDETGDMPTAVGDSADQIFSNYQWAKVVQAGNPSSRSGLLYRAASTHADIWHVIVITGDPDDPARSPRINIENARKQIELHGRDNPWIMSTILGKFPPSSINSLLGPDEVRDAMRRSLRLDQYDYAQKRIGVDVARFGDDRTMMYPRQGLQTFAPVEMRNARTNEIAARMSVARAKWGAIGGDPMFYVDDTGGYGGGVCDFCAMAGIPHIPVNFGGKADDPRYFNKRSEMWFRMADHIKAGAALPNRPTLVKELTSPTYTFYEGKLRLEEKALIKARLQFSPDEGDALALTYAHPEQPGLSAAEKILAGLPGMEQRQGAGVKHDWDPLEER